MAHRREAIHERMEDDRFHANDFLKTVPVGQAGISDGGPSRFDVEIPLAMFETHPLW